jgi:hypothetical protein
MREPLRVTVVDPDTGDTETIHLPDDDYVIICGSKRRVAHTQVYKTGTHIITVKPVTSDA